jgi:Protein of unknown function (DUF3800)
MDLNEWRNKQMRFGGLSDIEEPSTFYYDETNNVRKLKVNAQGFNVEEVKVFVLGGVVHGGEPRGLDLLGLGREMRIQQNVKELKFHHVAKGTFSEILCSKSLRTFLAWLNDCDLLIHYHETDPVYWSIVDIVDSILHGAGDPSLYRAHEIIKSDLTEILRAELSATTDLFHRCNYPEVSPSTKAEFLTGLLDIVSRNTRRQDALNVELLQRILIRGITLDSLAFLEGNEPQLLIDSFATFYAARIAMFSRSTHILDAEDTVQERLTAMPLTKDGSPATHFRFADSTTEPGIQLSDIVVGLLAKMHTFLTRTPIGDVLAFRRGTSGTGLENIKLLRDCLARSDAENPAFLHHVAALADREKIDGLLQFADGLYAVDGI